MFASYVNFSEKTINHYQISKGFILMYSHIAIVVAILMTTVATIYLNLAKVNLTFVAWLIVASIGLYYLANINFHCRCRTCSCFTSEHGGNDDYLVHLECSLCYVCWHKKSK